MDATRRLLLKAVAGVAAMPWIESVFAAARTTDAPAERFSFERLRERAKALSARPYAPPPVAHSALLDRIDYDAYQKIRFRRDHALWGDDDARMPVELFHLGRYARHPVDVYVVDDGSARRVDFSPSLFDYGDTGLKDEVPDDLGFSGFRVLNPGDEKGDWLAFQGASYFRSAGPLNQYGLSARGIAIDTAVPNTPEQFPRFTQFYLEQPREDVNALTVYALLDGESLSGAYRFHCIKGDTVRIDVHADLFQREPVRQLGVAPLTSMYWYSETNHREATDWRPEIHDSDGLAMWTGAGERIWRPLNSPPHLQVNTFQDRDPKGFGLLQRDRNFDHYQDDGVFYDRRPSVWVEPKAAWGSGVVLLMEMPTNDEIDDNIVAFWSPHERPAKGEHWTLDYLLHWVATEPYPPSNAHVISTRIGRSGIPGQHAKRDPNGRKFVIDFRGGPLESLEQRYDVDVIAEASRGEIRNSHALKVVGTDYWRASFDLHADGNDPVNLRCFLRLGDRTLTETWVYQYFRRGHPFY